ncbi:MAG: Hpt domain-containing protein [bacterium]|nr:Hpt domain-containing protein [bacterium]
MTHTPNDFPFTQHIHGGSEAGLVLAQESIQELLILGREVIVELVDTYVDDAAERVRVTVESFAAGDPDGVGRAAHALKSSSANMGALPFSVLCNELELLGNDGKEASMGPRVERLESMFVEVRQALVALRAFYQD